MTSYKCSGKFLHVSMSCSFAFHQATNSLVARRDCKSIDRSAALQREYKTRKTACPSQWLVSDNLDCQIKVKILLKKQFQNC